LHIDMRWLLHSNPCQQGGNSKTSNQLTDSLLWQRVEESINSIPPIVASHWDARFLARKGHLLCTILAVSSHVIDSPTTPRKTAHLPCHV
jgi:hypothetical protein